ncbi:hypothetical protein SLA2020_351800 [Shorea laevis]
MGCFFWTRDDAAGSGNGPRTSSEMEASRKWAGVEIMNSSTTTPVFSFKSGVSNKQEDAAMPKKRTGMDLHRPCLVDEPFVMENSNLHDVFVVPEKGLGHLVPSEPLLIEGRRGPL